MCPIGRKGWSSNRYSDWDNDGCSDLDEDDNDDNDGHSDENDTCAKGFANWFSDNNTYWDNDGCEDATEDDDDDNDGVNDVWLPVALGVTSYELQIFNRWGELVWESMDPTEPWLGSTTMGSHYLTDGLYHYQAKIEDQLRYPRSYAGSIQLLR